MQILFIHLEVNQAQRSTARPRPVTKSCHSPLELLGLLGTAMGMRWLWVWHWSPTGTVSGLGPRHWEGFPMLFLPIPRLSSLSGFRARHTHLGNSPRSRLLNPPPTPAQFPTSWKQHRAFGTTLMISIAMRFSWPGWFCGWVNAVHKQLINS